jgi:ferrous iron transport protein B
MLVGFGCTVPAIMATRTLSSDRDRRMTILLTPFMSCSAKVPVYLVFCSVFFPKNTALVIGLLYGTGVVVAIVTGLLLKSTVFRGNSVPFVLELPVYRFPSLKTVLYHLGGKVKDFLTKAFTIIFLGSLVIWFLTNLNWAFHMVEDGAESMLASLGSAIAPVFSLNGFDSWQAVAALLSGFAAKEAVVSTLSVVLPAGIASYFTPLTAVAFLVFTLLYTPCMAAIAATRREMGSLRWTIAAVLFQLVTAWAVSVLVFQVGQLLGF